MTSGRARRAAFLAACTAALALVAGAASRPTAPALIAFSTERGGNTDVYVAFEDGSGLRRVTTSPAADFDPSLSPDRGSLAYRCQVGTANDICTVGVDGGPVTDVTRGWPGDEWSPAWSPDGAWIAFFADRAPTGLWLIRPNGSDAHSLVGGGEYPSWSPDGSLIAYADMPTRDIAVVHADGTGKRLLARNAAYDMSPSFSPNGRTIAFDSQRGFRRVRERGIGPEFEIYVVGADGRHVRRLTRNQAEDRFPDFGPDGRIVFSREGVLWTSNRDGSHKRRLPLEGSFPDW